MTNQAHAVLAAARSFLFVPANRPERYAKALACGADAVIIDLEDAVPPADKLAARSQLAQGLRSLPAHDLGRVLVRTNAAGMPWYDGDLALLQSLVPQGLAGVVVPKAESTDTLRHVAALLGPACAVFPLVESGAGLAAVDALAACPQVPRLMFGNLDFQADLGLACGPDEAELIPVRLCLVLASRRASLAAPVDGVTAATQDMAQLKADVARSRRGGFGAKLCIHPAQVAVVHAELTPSAAELDWARRVQAGFADAGGGVFSLDGRMVDAPVVRLAERLLARANGKGAFRHAEGLTTPFIARKTT